MATIKDAEQVSHEMGNFPAVVLRHYWNWKTKQGDAKEFWALSPEVVMSQGRKAKTKKAEKSA